MTRVPFRDRLFASSETAYGRLCGDCVRDVSNGGSGKRSHFIHLHRHRTVSHPNRVDRNVACVKVNPPVRLHLV